MTPVCQALVFLLAIGSPAFGRLFGVPGKGTGEAKKAAVQPHQVSISVNVSVPAKVAASVALGKNATPVVARAEKKAKPAVVLARESLPAAPKTNSTAAGKDAHPQKKNLTEVEQLTSLLTGLETIQKLQATFTSVAGSSGDAGDMQRMAQGAMTSELGKKDSVVWSAIGQMLNATAQAVSAMKSANSTNKSDIMRALESSINSKAAVLRNVTEQAGRVQEAQSEEYLLGLLNQHRQEWSLEKQLNVTKEFAFECPKARELLKHYRADEPLAPQLAALMDARQPQAPATRAEAKAVRLFLQLADSLGAAA